MSGVALYESVSLPSLADQAERLISLGVADRSGVSPDDLRAEVARLSKNLDPESHPLLVIPPELLAPSAYADLLMLNGKHGFVVVDMTDVDEFTHHPSMSAPPHTWYALTQVNRGDHLSNWSPEEALTEFSSVARTPLTLSEGMSLLLQRPELLEPNKCFMTIGSRKQKDPAGKKLDARTPALWISGGTGRDGKDAKGAPKVGWCWANNRHTWLGFASAVSRVSAN